MPDGFGSSLYGDPLALAGLGVISGTPLNQALLEGARASTEYTRAQNAQLELRRTAHLQQVLPDLLQRIDIKNPIESLRVLTEAGVPLEQASTLVNQLTDNVRQQQGQDFLQNLFGGAAGSGVAPSGAAPSGADPTALIQAGLLYGRPELVQGGKFMYDQRKEAAEKATKEQIATEERTIPGLKLIPGARPNESRVMKATEAATAIDYYEQSLKALEDFIDQEGSAVIEGTPSYNRAIELTTNLLQGERTLNQTGVLNVGEIPTLERTYASFDPTRKSNVPKSRTEMKAALQKYKVDRLKRLEGSLRRLGYERDKPQVATPDISQARRGRDGNLYVPDPSRSGKYLKVEE